MAIFPLPPLLLQLASEAQLLAYLHRRLQFKLSFESDRERATTLLLNKVCAIQGIGYVMWSVMWSVIGPWKPFGYVAVFGVIGPILHLRYNVRYSQSITLLSSPYNPAVTSLEPFCHLPITLLSSPYKPSVTSL